MYKCILTAPSLLEDRLQAVENYKKMLIFYHALYKTNRFHITLCLFSDISHRTPKKFYISDTLGCFSCATLMF